jgi:membrane associated rhomboid family serine protease
MITYTLLAVIVIFSLYCFNDKKAMNKYMFHPYSIYHYKEHYRFLTHAFIHGDLMHLAFNCLTLYSIGLSLEENIFPYLFMDTETHEPNIKLGKILYLVLFTGGIYAASVTEYFRNKNNESYSSLGASGAISSVIFCWIILAPKGKLGFFFLPPMQGWLIGLILLVVSFYLIRRKKTSSYTDNISHESHFWGAIFGLVFILVVKPSAYKQFFTVIFGNF